MSKSGGFREVCEKAGLVLKGNSYLIATQPEDYKDEVALQLALSSCNVSAVEEVIDAATEVLKSYDKRMDSRERERMPWLMGQLSDYLAALAVPAVEREEGKVSRNG